MLKNRPGYGLATLLILGLGWACSGERLAPRDTGVLENRCLGLYFDARTGDLMGLGNKLTGETYSIRDEGFAVDAVEFRVRQAETRLVNIELSEGSARAWYRSGDLEVEVSYTLGSDHCFAEKSVTLTSGRDYSLRQVVVSRMGFAAPGLELVQYRHPQFRRPAGTEPVSTFFGRTPQGGFFTGVEVPFDDSHLEGDRLALGYRPSLKVKAGETMPLEPVYIGVYRTGPVEWTGPQPELREGSEESEVLPRRSESEAMVAMTSAILGPPRHGLVPMACGWHSEMQQRSYESEADVARDMRSLDFLAECGIDWLSDSHPWGGETAKMNVLGQDDAYVPGDRVVRFLQHAQRTGVNVVMWPTMTNTHPWWRGVGQPFRSDRPDWLLAVADMDSKPEIIKRAQGNCVANEPFFEWLNEVNLQGLETGYYKAWAMDGSFFGDGGWYTSIIPVDCASDEHDHLPGDSNYTSQKRLDEMVANVRRHYPNMFIWLLRPPMDLGVWSVRNSDAVFTLLESGTGTSNIEAGDQIRTWSRVRVHRDFFPHYLDQPLLFPSRSNRQAPRNWPSENLDYILLSGLSSSPNQLYYMPTQTGIPEEDKLEIHRWLEWGRENVAYLKVRRDLPQWPETGRIDGSAHMLANGGLVFLFNSGEKTITGEFHLTEESIGLTGEGLFEIVQEHPRSERDMQARYGERVSWPVPPRSPLVLRIKRL